MSCCEMEVNQVVLVIIGRSLMSNVRRKNSLIKETFSILVL